MSDVTPVSGWPIPTDESSTAIWEHISDLGNAIDADFELWSEVVPWTNLSIGGPFSAVTGFTPQFCVLGPLVFVRGMVTFTGSTFFGANMCWVPAAYGPGATQPHATTKVQNEDNVLQLMVSAAGAISCTAPTYATGSTPGANRAISVTGSWVRQGVF